MGYDCNTQVLHFNAGQMLCICTSHHWASICDMVKTTPPLLKGPAVIEQQYIRPILFLIPVVSHTLCINYPLNCINAMLWATFWVWCLAFSRSKVVWNNGNVSLCLSVCLWVCLFVWECVTNKNLCVLIWLFLDSEANQKPCPELPGASRPNPWARPSLRSAAGRTCVAVIRREGLPAFLWAPLYLYRGPQTPRLYMRLDIIVTELLAQVHFM